MSNLDQINGQKWFVPVTVIFLIRQGFCSDAILSCQGKFVNVKGFVFLLLKLSFVTAIIFYILRKEISVYDFIFLLWTGTMCCYRKSNCMTGMFCLWRGCTKNSGIFSVWKEIIYFLPFLRKKMLCRCTNKLFVTENPV